MNRRQFMKQGIGGGIIAGTALAFGGYGKLLAASQQEKYDLVAVRGGQPDVMFDRGIEAYGGMKTFVKKGQKVLVKPNIGWDVPPANGGNTHPALVKRIIEHCFNAGAKEVYVFDHTCDQWTKCYKNSGIEDVAKSAGAKVVSGDSESYYQEAAIPNGKRLNSAKIHELYLGADVILNVPVLKHHGSSRMTAGLKNWMGVVWDRGEWHRNDLHQCIADFATYRKPDLTIIDAYNVMKRNGPRGVSPEDLVNMQSQILSTDLVAADAAAAKLFGVEPSDIPHIVMASDLKVGTRDLDKISIKRIKL